MPHPADVVIAPADLRSYRGPEVVLFIGIDTGGSRVHEAFTRWRGALGLPDAVLRGVDVAVDTPRDGWRRLVTDMVTNPRVVGAVVTSHKLRLHRACRDLVDDVDPEVDVMAEISCLGTSGGRLHAHATDVVALDAVLRQGALADRSPFPGVVCLGGGGAATALLLALRVDLHLLQEGVVRARDDPSPVPLTIADVDPRAVAAVERVRDRIGADGVRTVVLEDDDGASAARLVATAPPGSLVVNATGLGKLGPGSPVPDDVPWPDGALAWDLNARGPLTFLSQARRAGVGTLDGHDYFLAGWASALAAMTRTDPAGAVAALRRIEGSPTETDRS